MSPRNTASVPSRREVKPRAFTVMVVDDEDDLRDSIVDLLASAEYNVVCAEDGEEALALLRGGAAPDLILLDLMMPHMDGWEFRDVQRADPALSSIPVVVMTATRNHRPIDVDQVLYKPVDPDTMIAFVGEYRSPASAREPRETGDRLQAAPATGSAELDTVLFSERFLDLVGHDLRNPISAMYLTGSLLSGQARDPETAEHAGRILNVVQRMDLTVSHILHFLRICLGKDVPVARTRTDLTAVCRRVVRSVTRSTGREIDLVAEKPVEGNWDPERLELLVSTLVREACDQDRSQGAIVVKASMSAEIVRLEVEHHGDNRARPLKPARPNDGAHSELENECMRVGLGMAIARRIVRAHDGNLRVDSDASQLTRVTVELPKHWVN